MDGIGVADVVRHLRVSARLANLRFSQAPGESIQSALTKIRLVAVKEMLSRTDYPLKRIALHCGFKSYATLSRLFARKFGMSMRTWRRKLPDG